MLFGKEMIEAMKAGKKRVTRRPVKAGDELVSTRNTDEGAHYVLRKEIQRGGRRWLREEDWYSIQPGRGKKAIGRFKLGGIVRAHLRDAGSYPAEWRSEGFESAEAFFEYWRGLYGEVDYNQAVWVLYMPEIEWYAPHPDDGNGNWDGTPNSVDNGG